MVWIVRLSIGFRAPRYGAQSSHSERTKGANSSKPIEINLKELPSILETEPIGECLRSMRKAEHGGDTLILIGQSSLGFLNR